MDNLHFITYNIIIVLFKELTKYKILTRLFKELIKYNNDYQ